MQDLVIHLLNGERGLRVAGELDMHSVQVLSEALADLPGTGQLKLDLSELTFVDSSGLHAFVAYGQNGNGPLILEGCSTMMLRLFEITGLAQHPNLDIRVAASVG